MKKRETIYICDHCGVIAREETEFGFGFYFKTLPKDWTLLGREHLCSKCSEIYRKFKEAEKILEEKFKEEFKHE